FRRAIPLIRGTEREATCGQTPAPDPRPGPASRCLIGCLTIKYLACRAAGTASIRPHPEERAWRRARKLGKHRVARVSKDGGGPWFETPAVAPSGATAGSSP